MDKNSQHAGSNTQPLRSVSRRKLLTTAYGRSRAGRALVVGRDGSTARIAGQSAHDDAER